MSKIAWILAESRRSVREIGKYIQEQYCREPLWFRYLMVVQAFVWLSVTWPLPVVKWRLGVD